MIPVVLSAGRGSRIGEETKDLPKWFLEIGDRHLYDYQLDALSERFDVVYVVLGHGFVDRKSPEDVIPQRDDLDIVPIIYSEWESVENAGSALFALDRLSPSEDLLLLCGDIIIHKRTIAEFVESYKNLPNSNCSAVAAFKGIQDEKTAVLWNDNKTITDYGAIKGHKEAGMFILNKDHVNAAREIWSDNLNSWFPVIFPEIKSKAICLSRSGHHEINTIDDLHTARDILANSNQE